MRLTVVLLFVFLLLAASMLTAPPTGIYFRFKDREMLLIHPMRKGNRSFLPRVNYSNKQLDTLSNWLDTEKNYVEIIRQDNPVQPSVGVALGFEFDEEHGEYPYTSGYAILQLKDFRWGGVEFAPNDTLNYTGISNAVSDDLTVEVLDFQNDTITGRFSGVLLNGAGQMTAIEEGSFRVRVFRK